MPSRKRKSSPHFLIPEHPYVSYEDYLAKWGALSATSGSPNFAQTAVAELEASGLRGRGGAGFPTGRKWRTLRDHPCPTRYVVCNAAEGEPGTFKDRYLLRSNPYSTLEGIALACRVIGAKEAYLAIKSSFVREISVLQRAIAELQHQQVFDDISLHLIQGPEEYLFGEEKALLNVIENEGPFPRVVEEPPYEVGLFATPLSPNPALVNNVETFARAASILRFGAESFRSLGTEDTPGLILCTLSGDVAKPGVYEIESGLPLREVLRRFGGGSRSGKRWKAMLPGVSAGPVLAKDFGVPVEFGAMKNLGSGLGSAGFIAIDAGTSIPAVARAVTRFLYVESCNQCSACKAGLRRASNGLDAIGPGTDLKAAFAEICEAAESAPQGNRCYLPVQGALLVPTLLKAFAKEFQKAMSDAEWQVPKIVDFDETTGTFHYDERQRFKQPDWTFDESESRAQRASSS